MSKNDDETILDYISDNLYDWILGICIVNFDIDLGQIVEKVYPPSLVLTEAEKLVIAYSSFPDSHCSSLGDTSYHFRFRSNTINKYIEDSEEIHRDFPSNLKPSLYYCYAYVYFRQHKDLSLKRNYLQKSIVILSMFPFKEVFLKVVEIMAPLYFKDGDVLLQTISLEISKWPKPCPNQTLALPIIGYVMTLFIPKNNSICERKVNKDDKHPPNDRIDDSSDYEVVRYSNIKLNYQVICNIDYPLGDETSEADHDKFMLNLLKPILFQLHNVWEIAITGQPLLVHTYGPKECSVIVDMVINSIAPLRYNGEYRPFFTIHDSDYKDFTLTAISLTSFPIVLGVTNPFFIKSLGHWPNVISLVKEKPDLDALKFQKRPTLSFQDPYQPGLYSQGKFDLKKVTNFNNFLKTLITSNLSQLCLGQRVKDYFTELTRQFLYPLEMYITSLVPKPCDINPLKEIPKMKHLLLSDFLKFYSDNKSKTQSNYFWIQGNVKNLYERFWSTSHFTGWISDSEDRLQLQINEIFAEKLSNLNLHRYLIDKKCSELEMVDILIHLKTVHNKFHSGSLLLSGEQRQRLLDHIEILHSKFPRDLQSSIVKT